MIDSLQTLQQHIEVIVTKKTKRFKATSPSFPSCKGFGTTKEEAIKKLSRSIGVFLAKETSSKLDKILASKRYSEVITTPGKQDDQHLIFNTEDPVQAPKQDIYLKLDVLDDMLGSTAAENTALEYMSVEVFSDKVPHGSGPTLNMDSSPSTDSNINSLLYGIQFSLN